MRVRKILLIYIILQPIFGVAQTPVLEWSYSFGTISQDAGWDVSVDNIGNPVFSGEFYGDSVDLDPGIGVDWHYSKGYQDSYIQKIDSSGNYIFAKSFGSANTEEILSSHVDPSGNIYSVGVFWDSTDIDPSINEYMLYTNGTKRDIFIQKLDSLGNFIWGHRIGHTNTEQSTEIITDNLGNCYISGFFSSNVDFDPGLGVYNILSNGSSDLFILKLNQNGILQWVHGFGGAGTEESIKLDYNNGYVYICGNYNGTSDFDPGPNTLNFYNLGIFVGKYDAITGHLIWGKNIELLQNQALSLNLSDVEVDLNDNVVLSGTYEGTIDFDPGTGVANSSSVGAGNSSATAEQFFLKLDNNGEYLWHKTLKCAFTGAGSLNSQSISIDQYGNIFSTGYLIGTVDVDPNQTTVNISSNGQLDGFVLSFDKLGDLRWGYNVGGSSADYFQNIVVDNKGNFYITGWFWGTMLGMNSTGHFDVFCLKFSDPLPVNQEELININPDFILFPNPTKNKLTIQGLTEIKSVDVLDYSGRIVKSVKYILNTIDVSDLPVGLYFIAINTEKYNVIRKFIKQ
jgi:hypothetical protein